MKKFFSEFKEFISRGDVMNLAVGVIIGSAFQAIVNSLVKDIVSPVIGLFANTNFDNLMIKVGGVEIKYGSFLTALINFIIMAFIIFLIVKAVNNLTNAIIKKEEKSPTTKKCPFCCSTIDVNAKRCPHCTSSLE
jgi:large conductance mechanosensitive channel